MIGVFRHQQMRKQCRRGAAPWGRHRRRRSLGDDVARLTGIFGSHVTDDPEVPGHVIENLTDVFAEPGHDATAVGAGASRPIGGLVHHLFARQMIRQRLALRLFPLAHRRGNLGVGRGLGLVFGGAALQFLEPQLKLFDLVTEPLR
jgi:hypothetical protein